MRVALPSDLVRQPAISHLPKPTTVPEVREFRAAMTAVHTGMRRAAADAERCRREALEQRALLDRDFSEEALPQEEATLRAHIESKERDMEELVAYEESLTRAEAEQLAELERLKA